MKQNIILSIVALLLIAGAVVGMIALVKGIENTFSSISKDSEKVTDTEKVPADTSSGDSSGGSSSSGSSGTTENSFYLNTDTMTGYHTISGVTYFFKKYTPIDGQNYISLYRQDIKSYGDFTVDVRYSYDAVSWFNFDWWGVSSGDLGQTSVGNGIYVLYTSVSGCTNPDIILEDLNQNVFFEESVFKVSRVGAIG